MLHFFPPLPPPQIWIEHLAHDGAGANDGHLHHDVVEMLRAHARQAGHLRSALHLKHADGVGVLQRGVGERVVGRQMREAHLFAVRFTNEPRGIVQHSHHAEAEQVYFDDAHVGAVFLVPLHDDAAGHGGGLQRNHGIELALADHHAA